MDLVKNWKKQYKNEVNYNGNVITLSGVIGDDWYGDISAYEVRKMLADVNEDITIKLNSPGGSAFEGIEIYNLLKDFPYKVTVEVTALAASAATFICMAADEVVMCTGSQMMIHNAWTYAAGNADDLMRVVEDLKSLDSSINEIYTEKTGLETEVVANYVKEAKMWNADETIEKGFAQRKKEVKPKEQANVDYEIVAQMISEALEQKLNNINTKNDQPDGREDGSISMPKNKLKQLFGGKQ